MLRWINAAVVRRLQPKAGPWHNIAHKLHDEQKDQHRQKMKHEATAAPARGLANASASAGKLVFHFLKSNCLLRRYWSITFPHQKTGPQAKNVNVCTHCNQWDSCLMEDAVNFVRRFVTIPGTRILGKTTCSGSLPRQRSLGGCGCSWLSAIECHSGCRAHGRTWDPVSTEECLQVRSMPSEHSRGSTLKLLMVATSLQTN